jgi:hypothetical protein
MYTSEAVVIECGRERAVNVWLRAEARRAGRPGSAGCSIRGPGVTHPGYRRTAAAGGKSVCCCYYSLRARNVNFLAAVLAATGSASDSYTPDPLQPELYEFIVSQ